MIKRKFLLGAAVVAVAFSAVAYAADVKLNAAGATFPAVIYTKWFDEFKKAHPGVQINYQAIGSGAGIRQLSAGTVDFGASDAIMTDKQIQDISKYHVLHFPTVLGGVVPTYNLPDVKELNFTGPMLGDIFLGKVTKWNDASIVKANPGVKLPNLDITVVHRSEGSGTTYVFTDYLSKVNPEWKSKVGVSQTPNWPVGLGAKGNEGVAGQVKQTPGAIGYVELVYAKENSMAFGAVQNHAGKYLKASLESVTAAAAATVKSMPADFRPASIVDAEAAGAYPISTYTYLLIPDKFQDAAKKDAIVAFLKWALGPGQGYAAGLNYAPLPKEVVQKEMAQISKIQ